MSSGLDIELSETQKIGKLLGDMCVGKRVALSMQSRGQTLDGYSTCIICTRGENEPLEGCYYLQTMHSQTLREALIENHYRFPG